MKVIRKHSHRDHPGIFVLGSLVEKKLENYVPIPSEIDGITLYNNEQALFVEFVHQEILTEQWKALSKYCHRLVITIPARDVLFSDLTQFFAFLENLTPMPKIDIVIQGVDQLMGFEEFFSENETLLNSHTLGFAVQLWPNICRNFLANFYQQVIWLLHHQQNPSKRFYIKEFPVQLEHVCHKLIETLLVLKLTSVVNIYFISTYQDHDYLARFNKLQLEKLNLSTTISPTQSTRHFYFYEPTLKAIIHSSKARYISTSQSLGRWAALPIMAIFLAVFTFGLHIAYRDNVEILQNVQTLIDATDQSEAITTSLNKLDKIITVSATKSLLSQLFRFNEVTQVHDEANVSYQAHLNRAFKSSLLDLLHRKLAQDINNSDLQLYSTLKTYIMLTTPQYFNATQVDQWFTFYWRTQYPGNTDLQKELQSHLQELLAKPNLAWPKDAELVQRARDVLLQLSPSDLVFLELQNQYATEDVAPFANFGKVPGINLDTIKIPAFYSMDNYKKINSLNYATITQLISTGNWVIGNVPITPLDQTQQAGLIDQVRQTYLSNFAKQWASLLFNITLEKPNSATDVLQRINLLLDQKSALIKALNTIITNASLDKSDLDESSQTMLLAVKNLVAQDESINKILTDLKNVNQLYSHISVSDDDLKASFEATQAVFGNPKINPIGEVIIDSKKIANPISNWLAQIGTGAWNILINNTQEYLNITWSQQVLPIYQKNIANHYPFVAGTPLEVNLTDFTQFFGPGGVIDQFFTKYLQNFANTSGSYWTWNTVNGTTIGVSQATLDNFIRASLIQQMFFTNDHKKPSFRFNLTAKSLSKNLASFTLNLDGQVFTITPNNPSAATFNWPGKNSGNVSITYQTTQGNIITLSRQGPWAWFRILDNAKIITTADVQTFQLIFSDNEYQAELQILSDNLVNPYIPGVIDKFQLPDKL